VRNSVKGTLLVALLVVPTITIVVFMIPSPTYDDGPSPQTLDFESLTRIYGPEIPVLARFTHELTAIEIQNLYAMGLRFSLGTPESSHVKEFYLISGPADGLAGLVQLEYVVSMDVQTSVQNLHATRDLSIPEIDADDVWATLDGLGRNITGEGIVIADLDSGIDWMHPDFWFADGSEYDWMELSPNGLVDNGNDTVDLNGDITQTVNERLYYIDLDSGGTFNTTTEWIWADNVTQNGAWEVGEPFFVVNDTNGNDHLDPNEKLTMLNTPKTRYIVEGDGTPSRAVQAWDRDGLANLTSSTHRDTDGHGTAVSGTLLGGQLGFRKYVGVAPDSELMMIKVLSDDWANNDWLTIEEGLTWAFNHGADVILIEVGSWTFNYLDGSSTSEALIDTIVASGVPVIAPSGNLGGKDKHALLTTTAGTARQTDFHVPSLEPPIEDVYITLLSINFTDFGVCNFSVVMNLAAWGGGLTTVYLHPGVGYQNYFLEAPVIVGPNTLWVESFISTSSRSTKMLGIHIYSATLSIPHTDPPFGPPYHQVNVTTSAATTFHAYISDDKTSWTGGAVWITDVSNAYEITWPSTADSALSVASYRTRSLVSAETIGDIAGFSSIGPRIDEVSKQGVAAPGGYDIITDWSNESVWSAWYNGFGALPFSANFGGLRLFSGTSASGPHVAGAAALMLQLNSTIGDKVADLIKSSARKDGFTGAGANSVWGHGKLNVSAAIESVVLLGADVSGPSIDVPTRLPASPQAPDDVTISVNASDPSGVDSVILSFFNGTLWSNVTMVWNGSLYEAVIPAHVNGTNITYRIYSNDTLGNWNVSPDYAYQVGSTTTTTTTTTTTGTTTGTTTTTTTTTTTSTTTTTTNTTTSTLTPTPTPTPPGGPDYVFLIVMLSFVLALVVLAIAYSRRR
jgi:subtilisin family serine protease